MTLTPIGNSMSILIPRAYLKALGVSYDVQWKIYTDGQQLLLRPIKEK